MDSRLVLTLMFVTLTGCFMGTYAEISTPSPVPTNSTNATSMNPPGSNPPGTNTTSMNPPSSNPPSTNATSMNPPGSNPPGTNATSINPPGSNPPSMNPPGSNPPGTNATSINPPGSNPPSMNPPSTSAANITTPVAATPPPIVPDSNVIKFNNSITRNDCGRKQLCAAQPPDCDPSSGTCFFLGAQGLGGQNFRFALSGDSDGYLAATLSPSTTLGNNSTTYICANNNGVVKYFSALLNNGKLTRTTLNVNNVKGRVSGKNIQCQFDATVPDSTSTKSRAATSSTSFSMSVSTGSYNATSDDLGSPAAKVTTGVVDLANVNATITNDINTTTTTTAPSNTTTNATTTAPSNTTTNATTAAPSNTTTNATTTASSNTTAATTPAPLVPDSNVTNLNSSITKNDCGKKQLCASQPTDCDPSSGTCFFLGAQGLGGQNFRFALSGDSDGYLAATLSPSTTLGNNDTTYICANNNGVVKYFSALLNNGKLTRTTLNVNNVKGRVSGKNIQCQFDATVPDSTSTKSRAATPSTTSFSMAVSTGSYNATSDDLGSPVLQLKTNVVDLSNVNATIMNLLNSTTNTTNTTTTTTTTAAASMGNAVTIQQSMMQALLITVGILNLIWL